MSTDHRDDAIQVLSEWDPAMPPTEAARLLGRGLREPVDGETATALFEKLDRLVLDLASAVSAETTAPTLIDETTKAALKRFARLLILGISRPENRTPLELAPHPYDHKRWRRFFEYVFRRAATVEDLKTAVADADTVEALLIAYGLTPTGAAHWVEQYRRELLGWLRMAAGAS